MRRWEKCEEVIDMTLLSEKARSRERERKIQRNPPQRLANHAPSGLGPSTTDDDPLDST